MTLISIVVPTWQRARLLPRCLASIAAQPGAWECLVVDDGSTDGTAALVARWTRREPRIRLLLQEHRGPSAARNTGLAAAAGTWIAFLDSDDEYLPGALAVLAGAAAAVPEAGVVCGGLTGTMRVDAAAAMDDRIVVRDALFEMLGFSIEGPRVQLIAAVFRRDVLTTCGGFDPSYQVSEDRELMIRVTATHRVAVVRRFVARYHEGHGDGASDRSLVDGSKLAALRRMLVALPDQPALQPRLVPGPERDRILRLRAAHLAMLDGAEAIRAEAPGRAAQYLAAAARDCDARELEALVVRLVYLLTYPASEPRRAAARCAVWLEATARALPTGPLATALADAAIGVRLWAALVLWRSGAPATAIGAVTDVLRGGGAARTVPTLARLLTRHRRRDEIREPPRSR